MNTTEWMQLIGGVLAGLFLVPMFRGLFRAVTVEVEDDHHVLLTRFGKLERTFTTPGLQWVFDRWAPWVEALSVSLARDFRSFDGIHVNDVRGTSVVVDLWVEVRVQDPARALFAIEDWDKAVRNLVVHAATAALSRRDFQQILRDHSELGAQLTRDVSPETERWGVKVDAVFIRNVSLLPEVSQQLFGAVAARLGQARAIIEEQGRIDIARLEAETSQQVATLIADAKGQYPLAIGRAYAEMGKEAAVLDAYETLYDLSQLRPHRIITFRGFEGASAIEAAMIASPNEQAPSKPSITH